MHTSQASPSQPAWFCHRRTAGPPTGVSGNHCRSDYFELFASSGSSPMRPSTPGNCPCPGTFAAQHKSNRSCPGTRNDLRCRARPTPTTTSGFTPPPPMAQHHRIQAMIAVCRTNDRPGIDSPPNLDNPQAPIFRHPQVVHIDRSYPQNPILFSAVTAFAACSTCPPRTPRAEGNPMTELSTMGRCAQHRIVRHELAEARSHGLERRHATKLQHLSNATAGSCHCEQQSLHRHTCSYDDVIGLLSASVPDPSGPEPPL